MMSLFEGFKHAFGTYSGKLTSEDGGPKLKGKATSIPKSLTVSDWENHITGKVGLGIIPIDENSEVKFAAIDIDDYTGILHKVNQRIQELKLPLVVVRTKSGGAHAYLFLKEFSEASRVQPKMREFAALLGYGNCEIFPKQTRIVAERGDIGQWINVPYFDAAKTERYALSEKGEKLDVTSFLDYAHSKTVTLDELLGVKTKQEEILPDGPPCLNHLASMGFPEGTRNNGLYNLAVYAKKLSPGNWEALVERYNSEFFDPPLPTSEVLGLLKSMRKKEFFYKCKDVPICNYCNMPQCRTKKHGIGIGGTGLPKFGSLSKLATEPPIWFLEVESNGMGGSARLELTTEDLQNQRRFQNRCMEALNIMPTMIDGKEWQAIIQGLLEVVTVIEMPVQLTRSGLLKQHLEDFCTGRAQAREREEVLMGKPWTNGGFHYFRMSDFMAYLERRKFREMEPNEIGMWMREWKADKEFKLLKGKGTTLTKVPEFQIQTEKFNNPIETTEPPYV